MKIDRLENMVRGWLVGNFVPAVYKTPDVEFAVQYFAGGSYEEQHHHKIATEITVIVSGKAEMNGITYMAGDIVVIEPNEVTDFRAITDTTTAVLKIPGVLNDKYLGSEEHA